MIEPIRIITNDSRICFEDQLIIDITHAIHTLAPEIRLTTNNEGPCAENIGLYALLDRICKQFDYPKSQIHIQTANLIEQHPDYNITIVPQVFYLNELKKHILGLEQTKTFDSTFRHFGHFIGHSNLPRLQVASFLHANYQSQTLQSYHCSVTDPYHRMHIGLEDLLFNHGTAEEFAWAKDLILTSPIAVDKIDSFPILTPTTFNITQAYPDFFVEIASISYYTGNTFYIDEKVWRPIAMRTPFILQGSAHFLQHFKRLGFKTFGAWWDEGYNEDPAEFQVVGIKENIHRLSQLTVAELRDMYQDMQPVLEHNWNRLQEIRSEDFSKVSI
jgi:hypothetical protein